MKKIHTTKANTFLAPQHRSFRRFFKQMFVSILKRQTDAYQGGFQREVLQHLKNLESQIEAVTRGMARKTRRKK